MLRTRTLGRSVLGAVAGVTLAASLTACGGGGNDFTDSSVEEIEKAVKADMKKATSLKMKGSIKQDGGETKLDLAIDTDGNCEGELGRDGAVAQILSVDGESYLKGDEAFWKASAGSSAEMITQMIGDKWAKMPSDGGQFDEFCDLDNFLEDLNDNDKDNKITKGETKDIDGEEALELITKEDGDTTRAWVATEGKHYFLVMEREGEESGKITFSDYDEKLDIAKPGSDEVVDLSQMGG